MILASGVISHPREGHQAALDLLDRLYRQLSGSPMPPIVREAGGKPRFETGPWHFSITHTRGHVFVALGKKPLGLDAEELSRRVSPGLAEKVLSPGEFAQYEKAPDKNRALLTFWVLKEAEAKRTGRGIRGYPNQTQFSLDDPRVFTREGCVLALMEGE